MSWFLKGKTGIMITTYLRGLVEELNELICIIKRLEAFTLIIVIIFMCIILTPGSQRSCPVLTLPNTLGKQK